tara:strand:- start:1389 stop:1631 length:243 start_codon:yes stop_codon:yes gene_type:complete
MRQIKINKYEGNTHYSVSVIDSYGKEHHLGYYNNLYASSIQAQAEEIWANEVESKVDLMAEAIKECIEIDKKNNVEPNLE